MVNNTNKVVALNYYKEYSDINEEVSNLKLSKTQSKIKKLPNSELLLEVTKSVAKSMHTGGLVVADMCKTIDNYMDKNGWINLSNNRSEENMKSFELEEKWINTVKSNYDFICAYTLVEERNSIWIVIKDSSFNFKKIYLKSAREFREKNNCEFNLIIFEEEQRLEVEEQLKYMDKGEVFNG